MGRILKFQLSLDLIEDDGTHTVYELDGTTGDIYSRRSSMKITPHYGNPGMPATQVEVHIDAMIVPRVDDPSSTLVRITELEPGQQALPSAAPGSPSTGRPALGQVLQVSEIPSGDPNGW